MALALSLVPTYIALPGGAEGGSRVECTIARERYVSTDPDGTEHWRVRFKLTNHKPRTADMLGVWEDWSWGGGFTPVRIKASVAAYSSVKRTVDRTTPGGSPDLRLAHCRGKAP